jgi:hypothetical protein
MQTSMANFDNFDATERTTFLTGFVPIRRAVLFRQLVDGAKTAPVTVHDSQISPTLKLNSIVP